MGAPKAPLLSEVSRPVPLLEIAPETKHLEQRELWRQRIAEISMRLGRTLGLRQSPLELIETPEGPGLRSVGIAGTIRVGRTDIDVAPKHVPEGVVTEWQKGLIVMLERVTRRRVNFLEIEKMDVSGGTFSDYFAYSFAIALSNATNHEPVRLYSSREEESPVLRGRLLVAQQLRSSLTKPQVLRCEVDQLDADNPINRLLTWAGNRLLQVATDGQVRRLLSQQVGRLPPVTSSRPQVPLRMSLPQQFAHYERALDLALALARADGLSPSSLSGTGAGFVVGTEKLFEQFLENSLLSVSRFGSWRVEAQKSEVFARPAFDNGGSVYNSKPDNIIWSDGRKVLVLDAKYKRFEDANEFSVGSRATNADLYQMAAAATAHGTSKALLVYPRLGESTTDSNQIRWWEVDRWGPEPLEIGVASVDLNLLGERHGIEMFDARLSAMINEVIR